MSSMNDYYTLNDGQKLPCIGFGTSRIKDHPDAVSIVQEAIKAGYRFFDTASIYETESILGKAIKECGLPREEFYIETKAWIDEMGYHKIKAAFEASLRRLQMDYVDLYLVHWPRQTGGIDESWKELDLETWHALEELQAEGKIKSLGCSNFLPHHLQNLLDHASVRPVVDQMELHLGHSQEAAVAYCKAHDIIPMAWSPLGRGRVDMSGEHVSAEHAIVQSLADKYGKSTQQIGLRFLVQKGILPIPRTSSVEHMRKNLDIFDFSMTEEEIWMLSCMPQTTWLGEHPDFYIPSGRLSNPNQK